jgi:hypothetical protein
VTEVKREGETDGVAAVELGASFCLAWISLNANAIPV